jgi:ABC-type sugar transport system ATPase subunit
MVAIVGRSGAGKTTLVNLLPRFYDVTGGVDSARRRGHPRRDAGSLRAQIGIVTQETVLFDDTIATNIAFGRPRPRRATSRPRRGRAHAHEFIVGLDDGYENADRRARPAPVGRPAPAPGDRPRPAARFADPDPRRGHLVARRRVGNAGAGALST